MQKKIREAKGITLVALVITVIILDLGQVFIRESRNKNIASPKKRRKWLDIQCMGYKINTIESTVYKLCFLYVNLY